MLSFIVRAHPAHDLFPKRWMMNNDDSVDGFDVERIVAKNSSAIKVVSRHHMMGDLPHKISRLLDWYRLSDAEARAVISAMDSGNVLRGNQIVRLESSNPCAYCGKFVYYRFNGKTVRAESACPIGGNKEPHVFEIAIPSGRMVVANDLREEFHAEEGVASSNNLSGLMEITDVYARVGLAHAFVGNTCPGVYQVDHEGRRFVIASGAYDEEAGRVEPTGKRVASISTDLWWYSIADAEMFQRRGGNMNDLTIKVISVPPGVYRFTHHLYSPQWEEVPGKPSVFTTVEWVRPC